LPKPEIELVFYRRILGWSAECWNGEELNNSLKTTSQSLFAGSG